MLRRVKFVIAIPRNPVAGLGRGKSSETTGNFLGLGLWNVKQEMYTNVK